MEYFSSFKEVPSIIRYGNEQPHYKLSVVIPTFNRPRTLKRVVQSAIDQYFSTIDYNIVIIENFEGDISESISLLSEVNNPKNIQIVYYQNEKNIGMQPNWNRCFEMANADYVLMVHTDDFLLPQCIRFAEEAINQSVPALYFSRYSLYLNDLSVESLVKEETISQRKNKNCGQIKFHKEKFIDVLIGNVPVAPTGFLVKKELFIQLGGFNTVSHTWPADLELSIIMIDKGKLFYCSKKLVVKTEGDNNDGSSLKSTVPLVKSVKTVFQNALDNRMILFKKQLLFMRLASISRGFNIDYDTYLKGLFPKYYTSKYMVSLYKKIYRICIKNLLNR